jgi:hypothetical protein
MEEYTMKRIVLIAVLVGVLAMVCASTALAAGPTNPSGQGFGPGDGTCGACLNGTGVAGQMMRRGGPAWAGQQDEVLKLLDMTAEELQVERLAGKSLAEIAADKDVSEETLINTIINAKKVILADLVADGKLSQAQMDAMVEHMQAQVKVMVERTSVGPAFDRDDERPGMSRNQNRPGMGQGQNDDQPGMGRGRGRNR